MPVPGLPNAGYNLAIETYDSSIPYFAQPAALYERVNQLSPIEESTLSGLPIAEITLTGLPGQSAALDITATVASPSSGTTAIAGANSVNTTATGLNTSAAIAATATTATTTTASTPIDFGTYTASAQDLATMEPLYSIAAGIVAAINMANTPFQAQLGPHALSLSTSSASFASIIVQSLTPQPFTLALKPTLLGAYVATQGVMPAVSVTFKVGGTVVTAYGMVAILDQLLNQIASSANTAAISKADIVTFNPNEAAQREALYRYWQMRLATFFFGPKADRFLNGNRSRGAVA